MLKELKQRGEELVQQARHRAHLVRVEGRERLFLGSASALERLEELLGSAAELPVVGERVVGPASKLVGETLERRTAPELEDYDRLNAKTAAKAVRELDHVGLLKVRRYEAAHKNRKTVLDAVEAQLEKLALAPAQAA